MCVKNVNGAVRERSETNGGENERNESTTLIRACRVLTYVLEVLEECKHCKCVIICNECQAFLVRLY